jgi:hypothetical protein
MPKKVTVMIAVVLAVALPGAGVSSARVIGQSDTVPMRAHGPLDPTPACDFPSNSWWWYCWGTPYSGPYTQAWIGQEEYDPNYGYHHNVHLQPRGLGGYTDYLNLHVYFTGVIGSGGGAKYEFQVYCSDSSGYRKCDSWNGTTGGAFFTVNNTICPTDGYNCASSAAGDMKNCLVQGYSCPFTNSSFVNSSFPNIGTNILQHDANNDPGTLQNAFCDALNNFKTCSNH